MSFASSIKAIKKEFKVVEDKKDKETKEIISKEVEVNYSKDAIEYINEYMEKVIKMYNEEVVKENNELESYINDVIGVYEKNKENPDFKNTQQKSGLIVNATNVNKFIELPEGVKKLKKEELVSISAYAEKILKMLIESTSNITVTEFKKHTANSNHVKLGIVNNSLLLRFLKV